MFGGLSRSGIERLIAKEIVRIFKELASKRNQWVVTPVTCLRKIKRHVSTRSSRIFVVFVNFWGQSGHSLPSFVPVPLDGNPTGTYRPPNWRLELAPRSQTMEFLVGDSMLDGELYLCDGAQTPLHLASFVQLQAAPATLDSPRTSTIAR